MLKSCLTMNERELGEELSILSSALSLPAPGMTGQLGSRADADGDTWRERKAALEQLERFAQEDIASRPIFAQMLSSSIKVPLLDQLSDKRNTIVSAACKVVSAFARCSSNRTLWAHMCVWLLQPLLSLTARTGKGVTESADQTLQVIMSHSGFGAEAMGELLKSCRARHSAVRYHAMKALLSVMRESKGNAQHVHLAKLATPVMRVIESGVRDASEDVRKEARRCYWGLYAMKPAAASQLFARFEASTRALVNREKADALQIIGAVEAHVVEAKPPSVPGGNQREELLLVTSGAGAAPLSSKDDALLLQDELQAVAADRARKSSASARSRRGLSPRTQRSLSPTLARSSALSPGSDADFHGAAVKASEAMGIVGTPRARHSLAGDGTPAHPPSQTEWKVTQDALMSTDWEMRLGAVESLSDAMKRMSGDVERLSAAFSELSRRVSDPHFRVCLAALSCLTEFISSDDGPQFLVDPHLQNILLALLVDLGSRKAAVQQAAARLLDLLMSTLQPGALELSLFQCLDDVTTPIVRARTLETLQLVFDRHWEHYTDPAVTGHAVRTLVHQLRDAEKPGQSTTVNRVKADFVRGPAANALRVLKNRVPEVFTKVVSSLDGDDQALVRSTLGLPDECDNKLLLLVSEPCDPDVLATAPTLNAAQSLSKHLFEQRHREAEELKTQSAHVDHSTGHTPATASMRGVSFSAKPSPTRRTGQSPQGSSHSARALLQLANPTEETKLFHTPFTVDHYVDANAASSPSYPFAGEEADDGRPRAAEGGPSSATIPLMHGRRWSATPAMDAPAAEEAFSAKLSPKVLNKKLRAPESTADDLSSALDAFRNTLSRSRDRWSADELVDTLGVLFERLCTEHAQPHHGVRCRAFSVLRALFEVPAMRPVAARRVDRILRVCRAGLDDAFFEVQQEASLAMHTVLRSCHLPVDLCLRGLASVLEWWQRGQSRDDCTRGWLEMLSETGRTLERVHAAQLTKLGNADPGVMLTEAVLKRVVRVVHWCAGHCAAEVRRTSILVLVALWQALQQHALPFFVPLSATQRKLVSIYYNKAVLLRQNPQETDVGGMLRDLLRTKMNPADSLQSYRDLNSEMRAAGYPDATTL